MSQQDEAARMIAFEGIVKLLKWQDSSTSGPKVTFGLLDRDALAPFEKATKRRGRKSGQRYTLFLADSQGEPMKDYPDECYLLGAQWNHTAGASVTFAFTSVAYWRDFSADDAGGTPFHLTLVELGSDETPVDQVSQDNFDKAIKRKGGPRSKFVAQRNLAKDFQMFVGKRTEMPEQRWDMIGADTCDKWVKAMCGVESKVDFDYDSEAWNRYERLIQRPFLNWARSYFGESYGRN